MSTLKKALEEMWNSKEVVNPLGKSKFKYRGMKKDKYFPDKSRKIRLLVWHKEEDDD